MDRVVDIATGYGLDGPDIESTTALGPTEPPIRRVQVSCPEVKRPERDVDYPPLSSAEVKERGQVYL
jgi:hypothetical protein